MTRYRYVLEFSTERAIPADVLADLQRQLDVQIETLSDGDLDAQQGTGQDYSDVSSSLSRIR